MDWLARDLRIGARMLARDKGFSTTAALTLAICIGANTALFTAVPHLLLRKTLGAQLFGIPATAPAVVAAVTALLAAVALAACALPARRATRINPVIALTE